MGLELRRIIPHLRNCRRKMFMIFLKLVIGLRMKTVGPLIDDPVNDFGGWCGGDGSRIETNDSLLTYGTAAGG